MHLQKCLSCVILLAVIHSSFGWRKFWKGRHIGGNLGGATTVNGLGKDNINVPPVEWLEQMLEHFNLGVGTRVNGLGKDTVNLPPDEWFEQMLDHFNPTNVVTWKQRFYTNDEYYQPGGPVFLMIGGEGEATADWMVKGAWIQYAKEHKALCFQLEHRFYGKSHPTE